MHALHSTPIRRTKRSRTKRDSDIARITAFAQRSLSADDAAVIFVASAGSTRQRPSIEQRLCDRVVETGATVVVADVAIDPSLATVGMMGADVAGYLGVPVQEADGNVIGALCVTTRAPRIWSRKDRECLEFLGSELDSLIKMRAALKAEVRRADQQALIAREYHHRVRNAFSISSAVVVLSGAKAPSVQSLVETTSAQLAALADAHAALGFEEESTDLGALVDGVLRPYSFSDVAIGTHGPKVEVSQDQLVSLGLILNELATNSTKHGALRLGGLVNLRWSVVGGQVVMRWTERSPVQRSTPLHRSGSFGGTMIDLSISQLKATLDRRWLDNGLQVVLRFPV